MVEARKSTGPASSSGWPTRPSGVCARKRPIASGVSRVTLVMGVAMTPGAMALTRMPSGARSWASARVSCRTAPLLAA